MYKQARGVLPDPSKKSNTEPKTESKRANSTIKTNDRPKGNGRSYSKENRATNSKLSLNLSFIIFLLVWLNHYKRQV